MNTTGERGIYKFDKLGILRFYGYLLDSDNNYYFGIEYDSTGNEIVKPKSNVVRWFVSRFGKNSLKLSFLLFDINRSYGDVVLAGKSINIKIPLFESKHFSNLIAGEVVIPIPEDSAIYISGVVRNPCESRAGIFRDSVFLPNAMIR